VQNSGPDVNRKKFVHGRSSLTVGAAFPPAFPDVVLDALAELKQTCEATVSKVSELSEVLESTPGNGDSLKESPGVDHVLTEL